jgi:hypothetical protein
MKAGYGFDKLHFLKLNLLFSVFHDLLDSCAGVQEYNFSLLNLKHATKQVMDWMRSSTHA